jgi:hypothetical protein
VSATAEPFGGALGIAVLYSIFHASYLDELPARIDRSPITNLTDSGYVHLRATIEVTEAHGWSPARLDSSLRDDILIARSAAGDADSVTFGVVTIIVLLGAAATGWLVHRPQGAAVRIIRRDG